MDFPGITDDDLKVSTLPIVYIAGPYTASSPDKVALNIKVANMVGQSMLLWGLCDVLVPHNFHSYWDNLVEASRFYGIDLKIIKNVVDVVYVLPGYMYSKGTKIEIKFAYANNIPVFFDMGQLHDWLIKKAKEPYSLPTVIESMRNLVQVFSHFNGSIDPLEEDEDKVSEQQDLLASLDKDKDERVAVNINPDGEEDP